MLTDRGSVKEQADGIPVKGTPVPPACCLQQQSRGGTHLVVPSDCSLSHLMTLGYRPNIGRITKKYIYTSRCGKR